MSSKRIVVAEASLAADARVDEITMQALVDRLRKVLEVKPVSVDPMNSLSAEPSAAEREYARLTLRGLY